MANDIGLAKNGQPIKNGSLVVTPSPFSNSFDFNNTNVQNLPTISTIENKYDNRFDDIVYYSLAVRGTPVSGCC
jgi:hypothetical protein